MIIIDVFIKWVNAVAISSRHSIKTIRICLVLLTCRKCDLRMLDGNLEFLNKITEMESQISFLIVHEIGKYFFFIHFFPNFAWFIYFNIHLYLQMFLKCVLLSVRLENVFWLFYWIKQWLNFVGIAFGFCLKTLNLQTEKAL